MEEIIKIAVVSMISVIFSLVLAEKSPFFSICIILAVGIYVITISMTQLSIVLGNLNELVENAGISMDIFQPVIKVCAIAIIVKISSELCKDAGFSAVAQKIQFAGSISSIIAVFPLFLKIIALLQQIV
ncbi:MAG: SpoIIIAC/SpoIIIAD family protein [Clostridia bacterium]